MKTYDSIISLGGCCATAMQLSRRGLRPCSYGLDWVGNPYDAVFLSKLADGFRSGFSGFCQPEHLTPAVFDGHSGMRDDLYLTYLPHNFKMIDGQPKSLRRDCEVVRKRIDRMMTVARRSQSVFFILCTYYEFEAELAKSLLAALREVFPETEIRLRVLQFHAVRAPFGVNVGRDGLELYRYSRELEDRDCHGDMAEWMFLDEVRLSGLVSEEHRQSWYRRIFHKLSFKGRT